MAAYLTLVEFKTLSVMPSVFVDEIEAVSSGWTLGQLTLESARMDARLRKRYAAPFDLPAPVCVQGWLAKIVTLSAYVKRGFDPTDKQGQMYVDDRNTAVAEIKEAADAVDGLFDLPLRADTTDSGISKASPRAYSEQSPYVFTDGQRRVGTQEDGNGGGTFT
jgi:hypothetical protein